jgi:hypothetical protein
VRKYLATQSEPRDYAEIQDAAAMKLSPVVTACRPVTRPAFVGARARSKERRVQVFYEEFSSGPYIREPGTESESGGRSDGESGANGAGKLQFPKPQRKGREQHSRDAI